MTAEGPKPAPDRLTPSGPAAADRVIRNSASNLTTQGLYAACNVIVVVILARAAGKEVLGGYYTLFALVTVAQILLEAGLSTLLTCRIAQAADDWRPLAREATRLFGRIALASAAVFLAGGTVWAWLTADAGALLACAMAGLACAAIQLQRLCFGVFRAFDEFRPENISRVLQATLFTALTTGLAVGGRVTVPAVVTAFAASHVVAAAVLLVTLQRRWGCLSFGRGPVRAGEWLRRSGPLGAGDVLRGLSAELDTLVLGLVQPAAVVGVYTVAYRPVGPLGWVARGILAASFSSLARLAARDTQALDRAATQSTRLLWVVGLPLAVAVCVAAEPLVLLVAGPAYLDAVLPMRLLAWLVPLTFLTHQLRFFMTAAGRTGAYGRVVAAAFALKVAAAVVLIPLGGYLGACAASLGGELALAVAGLAVCTRLGVGRLDLGAVARSGVAAGAMAALICPALGAPLPVLAFVGLAAFAAYFVVCVLLGAVRPDEVRQVWAAARGPSAGVAVPAVSPSGAGGRCRRHTGETQVEMIQSAASRMAELRSGVVPPPVPLTTAALAAALREEVRGFDLWRVTWNRIYLVHASGGRTLVAKQADTQTPAEFDRECDQFAEIRRLGIAGLDVPRVWARLARERTYVVDRLPGRTLSSLLAGGAAGTDLMTACELAGRVLGRLHTAWVRGDVPVPAAALRRDLEHLPGGFSRRQWGVIDRALDALAGARVAVGQPYLDFNARNVLYHDGALALIDPPKETCLGLLLWDYATFRVELRRELWKGSVARPWARRGRALQGGLDGFERGYLDTAPVAGSEPDRVPLLVLLLELQRVGQLMVQRATEVELAARATSPIPRCGGRLRCLGVAAASVGLLRAQKRWLVRRIAAVLDGDVSPAATKEPVGVYVGGRNDGT